MKIAWFTPFSRKSGISKYSQSITNALVKNCEVDLWVAETTDLLQTELKVFHYHFNEDLPQKLKEYDFIVYNMGDHLYFHKDIYEISKKVKSIVILHDFVMHHFFVGYYLIHKMDSNAYVREMERLYGVNGRKIAIDSINGSRTTVWETEEVINYPLFEKAIEGAMGVICHSQYLAGKVNKNFLGPFTVIYHPFYSYEQLPIVNQTSKSNLGISEDKILMVTIGHVNPNKRMDKVINILGEHKDFAEKVIYIVIGPHEHVQYYSQLQSLVEKYNLQDSVKFLGYQPDNILFAYMANADIFVNLRFPAMEGASWSLVEQLYFGKPIIVSDIGFYSELPDDCVMKINMDREKSELFDALKKLVFKDKLREEIGTRGKQFAIGNFNVQKYCKAFFDFLDEVKNWSPVLGLVDKVGVELALMGISQDSEVVDKVARQIYQMIGGGKQSL